MAEEDEEVPGIVSPKNHKPAQYLYPFAASPDIIRSNQKDAYFQAVLLEHISNALRNIYGVRFLHRYGNAIRLLADTLYLSLTTLIGNRTLGEEYCDIVQVQGHSHHLPNTTQRVGYILTGILLPYSLSRLSPAIRRRLRSSLETSLRRRQVPLQKNLKGSTLDAIQSYMLRHLDTLTSPAPVYAASLIAFYFSGAYYHLSKRIWGLRYIFTKRVQPSDQRVGYEVLGVLLVLQLAVQSYVHLRSLISSADQGDQQAPMIASGSAHGVQDATSQVNFAANNVLIAEPTVSNVDLGKISRMTHTPANKVPRLDLSSDDVMQWLPNEQARKCTLCLEPMKDPSVTTCGHIFCWACICDWCREKPECPLCRQNCLVQHILPLRE